MDSKKTKKKILIIENESVGAKDLESLLINLGYDVIGIGASGEESLKKIKTKGPDLVLINVILKGGIDGVSLADKIREKYKIPVIFLTAHDDKSTLKRALIADPFEYIVKPFREKELEMAIKMAFYKAEMEHALFLCKESFTNIVELNIAGILVVDKKGIIKYLNPAAELFFGKKSKSLLDRDFGFPIAKEKDLTEIDILRKNGEIGIGEMGVFNTQWEGKEAFLVLIRDVTKQKKAEELFSQSQKMETVGQLVGGIAHDFNNIMTVILGNVENLLAQQSQTGQDNKTLSKLKDIKEGALDASVLTKKLLTLGRKDVAVQKTMNLKDIFEDIKSSVEHLIPENISLKLSIAEDLYNIKADETQIKQIILNIILNAKDAIHNIGTITVEARNTIPDKVFASEHKLSGNSPYIILSISDTGHGVDNDTIQHMFEPFYTTKPVGKGIGLGLSTVYQVVQGLKGCITVESKKDKGTKFNIYIPACIDQDNIVKKEKVITTETALSLEGVTILFTEDNPGILKVNKEFLETAGCTVLAAEKGSDAILLASTHKKGINLLVTDVIMPEMNGVELYESVSKNIPGLKVIYTSGFTDDILEKHGVFEGEFVFLQKPYSPQELLKCIQETLGKSDISDKKTKKPTKTVIPKSEKKAKKADEDNLNCKALIKNKDVLMPLLNNAISFLSEETVYPLAEKLKSIRGLASLAAELTESIDSFDIEKVEISLKKILEALEKQGKE